MTWNPESSKDISEDEYKEELERTDSIVLAAMRVSMDSGGIKTSNRFIVATQLYTRLVVVSMTYMRILPFNRYVAIDGHHTDWPSAATLCRSIMEAYLSFFYIGLERVSKLESDFRMELFTYHRNSEKYKYFKEGGSEELLKPFRENLPKDKEALGKKADELGLSAVHRKRALSGRHAHYLSRDEILARIPFGTKEVPRFYTFFSYQVHSTPLAFMSQSNDRGRREPNPVELEYLVFTMWLVRKYLSAAVVGMHQLFPHHYRERVAATRGHELAAAFVLAKAELASILKANAAGA